MTDQAPDLFTEVTDDDVRTAIESGARTGRISPFNAALLEGKMLFVADDSDYKQAGGITTFAKRGKKMRYRTADGGRYYWLVDKSEANGFVPDLEADEPPIPEDA